MNRNSVKMFSKYFGSEMSKRRDFWVIIIIDIYYWRLFEIIYSIEFSLDELGLWKTRNRKKGKKMIFKWYFEYMNIKKLKKIFKKFLEILLLKECYQQWNKSYHVWLRGSE